MSNRTSSAVPVPWHSRPDQPNGRYPMRTGNGPARTDIDLSALPMRDEEIEAARQCRLSRRMPVDVGATVVGRLVRSATDTPDQIFALGKAGTTTYRRLALRVAAI